MDEHYSKLLSSIVSSSIWSEDDATRVVWITMLALKNRDGYVAASVPGLARIANVSIEQTEAALEKFRSPDPYSRSKEYEGRRIADVDGGWLVLNHAKIRDSARDPERRREQNREAQARWRDKQKRKQSKQSKQPSAHTDTDTDTDTEADTGAEVENRARDPIPAPGRRQVPRDAESGCVTPETLREDLTASEVRAEAFRRGFDNRAVARIFSAARDEAGLGKYVLSYRHYERAEEALLWSFVEDEHDPAGAIERSARAYFRHGGDWEREAGFPFAAWAADPGKWLAIAAKAEHRRRRRNGNIDESAAPADLEANATRAKDEVAKVLSTLKRKRGGDG